MLVLHRSSRPSSEDRAAPRSPRFSLRTGYGLLTLAAFTVASLLLTRSAEAQVPIVDLLTHFLRTLSEDVSRDLQPMALNIAAALAVIELVVFAVAWRENRLTLAFPMRGLAVRAVWWTWIFVLLADYGQPRPFSVGHFLLDGAEEIASSISGIDGFAPHAVLAQGWALFLDYSAVLLSVGIQSLGLLTGSANLGAMSFLALSVLLVLASYYVVALALYLLVFQSLLTLAIGPLFVAFGASRWTARLHDGYLTFAFSLAIKILLFAIVLKIGDEMTGSLFFLVQTLADLEPAAVLSSSIPLTLTLASLSYALGAMLTGPIATRLTAGTFEIATAILPQRSA